MLHWAIALIKGLTSSPPPSLSSSLCLALLQPRVQAAFRLRFALRCVYVSFRCDALHSALLAQASPHYITAKRTISDRRRRSELVTMQQQQHQSRSWSWSWAGAGAEAGSVAAALVQWNCIEIVAVAITFPCRCNWALQASPQSRLCLLMDAHKQQEQSDNNNSQYGKRERERGAGKSEHTNGHICSAYMSIPSFKGSCEGAGDRGDVPRIY